MVKKIGPVTVYAAKSHAEPNRFGCRHGRHFFELFLHGHYVGVCR